ncbi:MAG: hypothetical protein JWL73_711 [Actinomycetia bacterium]|nr:hypothetical protein [Actinomycetes bacterium]
MPPAPDVLRRAATTLRTEAEAVGATEAGTIRAFVAAGWSGPAARRFDAALREQGRALDAARRDLHALADAMDRDAFDARRVLLDPALGGLAFGGLQ